MWSATGVLLYRNFVVYRHAWKLFITGFLEPVFYLFSVGIGVGQLVEGFTFNGQQIGYAEFVAPAMLATSAMNGAIMDATYNVFFKLRFEKLYDQMLVTPLTTRDIARGEIAWCLVRGGTYSAAFVGVMVAMGLVSSWWALLALPAAWLVALAFASVGMALTTWMKSWQDFDKITLALVPLFLFSATFFPADAMGPVARPIIEVTPLYRGVVLCRELCTGALSSASLVSVVYLVAMTAIGLWVVGKRLDKLLLT
ncbi:MAG: ABC transporter permease [Nocardioides sp.]